MQSANPATLSKLPAYARIALATVLILAALYIAPLAISLIEHTIFGTDHFEDWARKIGVHDTIDKAYKPIKALLRLLQ